MSLLNSATSALLANQRAIGTVSNNIANVNTEGYSRQRTEFAERTPVRLGDGFIGRGVNVAGVERAYDRFINDRLTSAISGSSQQDQLQLLADQVNNLLASEQAGLSPALDRFFNAFEDLATDPTSTAARSAVISEAQSLSLRFQDLYSEIDVLRQGTTNQIRATVSDINARADTIARLNGQIAAAGTTVSNQLLDERDQEIRELAELIGINTVPRNTGAIDIFIEGGQILVLGTDTQEISVGSESGDSANPSVIIDTQGGNAIDLTDRINGGSLAGLIEFRERFLNPVQNSIGRTAVVISDEVNARQALGLDLNGQPGTEFFSTLTDSVAQVFSKTSNTGTATFSAQITDANALSGSDYSLVRTGANYTLTRLTDGVTTDVTAALSGGAPASFTIDGVQIDLTAGAINDSDRFLIQPTRTAAALFNTQITDGSKIAAAGVVRTQATQANTGSATISPPTITDTTNLPLSANGGPITLTFDAANAEFVVTGGPGGTLAYDPATEGAGKTFSFPGYGGIEFTVAGVPDDGDSLRISDNTGAVGDNANALSLVALRTERVVGGNATLNDSYGSTVADIGSRTRQVQTAAQAQAARLDAAQSQQASVAGVNLDEEAARLLQLQQAYQAAARAITVADEIFASLLRAVGGG